MNVVLRTNIQQAITVSSTHLTLLLVFISPASYFSSKAWVMFWLSKASESYWAAISKNLFNCKHKPGKFPKCIFSLPFMLHLQPDLQRARAIFPHKKAWSTSTNPSPAPSFHSSATVSCSSFRCQFHKYTWNSKLKSLLTTPPMYADASTSSSLWVLYWNCTKLKGWNVNLPDLNFKTYSLTTSLINNCS